MYQHMRITRHHHSAKFRGKGTDLSKVEQFKKHETDCGSPEVQVRLLYEGLHIRYAATCVVAMCTTYLLSGRSSHAHTHRLHD